MIINFIKKFWWLWNVRKTRPHLWECLNDESALDDYFSKNNEHLVQSLKQEIETKDAKINDLIKINQYLTNNTGFVVAKMPEWFEQGITYTPKTLVYTTALGFKYYNVSYRDLYVGYYSLKEIANKFKGLSHDLKLKGIWDFVTKTLTYINDKGEDWRAPNLTKIIGYGDCEDGTILFVTLCAMCGIPSDSVFNACGYFYKSGGEKYGHSFPIAKREDGLWYIFETTLSDSSSKRPKLFKGSSYDASWGIHNWAYQGFIKGELIDGKRQI